MADAGGKSHTLWMETHSVPLRDAMGTVTSMLSVARDVGARKQAERDREQLHGQLLIASRQAGMAEIATSVLHNVGNVLNSVNVSAKIIRDRARSSRQTGLLKASEMIRANADDLVHLFTQDPRGKQLPEYLHQLSVTLQTEREQIESEVTQLLSGVEHIIEIVRLQQTCASNSTLRVKINPVQIMEEAVRVNLIAMDRHHITVHSEFQDTGTLLLDQHKILQVLVNLLANAKQALSGVQTQNRQIWLSVGLDPSGERIIFAVRDNGCGISPENLPCVFRQGFTTRAEGHGFGLHSAINAATEMGGALTAHSAGMGQGATFTLSIPATRVQIRDAA